jgi:hypothetical protein
MQRNGRRHAINFIVDDNFLLRITHQLSNNCQAFCERQKTAQ